MDWFAQITLLTVSLAANAFSAFVGGGAGLLQLPALLFLGLPFSVALATHKVATVALGVGASMRHLKNRSLEGRFALFVLACGIPGVVAGATVIVHINDRAAKLALGVLTVGLGLFSMVNAHLGQSAQARHRDAAGYAGGGLGLFLIGVLNGSLTSGTGLFVTLWLILWFGLDYKRAVAYTLVLVGLFWNGAGAVTLGIQGGIYWAWIPALLVGSLLGGYAGAHLSIIKGNRLIKRVFEVVTLLVGAKLIVG